MSEALFIAYASLFVFTTISALVARSAARDARASNRRLLTDLEAMHLQLSAVSAGLRRVEGRQTGLLRKSGSGFNNDTQNGLPDPATNPEGWRAAVRMMAIRKQKQEQN